MRDKFIYVLIVFQLICVTQGYRTFSMRDIGSCSKRAEINLGSFGRNSSGILIADFDTACIPSLQCTTFIRSSIAHGIVLSVKSLDLQPGARNSSECHNYLEITPVAGQGSVRLCGYSFDEYEFKSFTVWGRGATVSFRTSNCSSTPIASFQMTFTSIRKDRRCHQEEKLCRNGYCIWKGLICDGHNNCGDLSDEMDKFVSQCGKMSVGESLSVIIVTIVGSLGLLILAAYFRGPKIALQIEQLSQCRRPNCSNGPDVLPQPTEPRLDDLPPSYEEVVGR